MESIVLSTEPILIASDINIHVDVSSDLNTVRFMDLLDSMTLIQHVTTPTHQLGHTLDVLITRETDLLLSIPPISGSFLSDHFTVLRKLTLRKPHTLVKEASYRKIKSIDIQAFKNLKNLKIFNFLVYVKRNHKV